MAHTDADAYVDELTPPTVTIGGVTFTGRFLSIREWLLLQADVERFQQQPADAFLIERLLRKLADAIYPPPPRPSLWARLRGARRAPSVADRLLELPLVVQVKVLRDFTAALMAALEEREEPTTPAPSARATRSVSPPRAQPATG